MDAGLGSGPALKAGVGSGAAAASLTGFQGALDGQGCGLGIPCQGLEETREREALRASSPTTVKDSNPWRCASLLQLGS